MKRYLPFFLIIIGVILISALVIGTEDEESKELTVYAYDSFISEWGPGPQLAELFEQKTGITLSFVSPGDAGQMLQKLIEEKDNPRADAAVGIDNNLYPKAREAGVLEPYTSSESDTILPEARFSQAEDLLTPYDYGYFAVIWDSKMLEDPPHSLEELCDPKYKKKLIIMDPRTSTPGLGMLLWAEAVYGAKSEDFFRRLSPNLLTVSSGWDAGYGLFTEGEAPLVLSYTSSPAYHLEYDKTERYQALIFEEGHYRQIEGAGVVKGAKHPKNAQIFIDFLLSREAQEILPLTNWMYPVRSDADLPESYRLAPKPEISLGREEAPDGSELDTLIDSWLSALGR